MRDVRDVRDVLSPAAGGLIKECEVASGPGPSNSASFTGRWLGGSVQLAAHRTMQIQFPRNFFRA